MRVCVCYICWLFGNSVKLLRAREKKNDRENDKAGLLMLLFFFFFSYSVEIGKGST